MRYVLMTIVGPEHVRAWEASSAEEKRDEIARVTAWFREHGMAGRIKGGEELGAAAATKTVRKRGISDGPFVETKELLGGFIIVDVEDEATAIEMARGWPGLAWDGDAVEVRPVGSSEADADAQEAAGT